MFDFRLRITKPQLPFLQRSPNTGSFIPFLQRGTIAMKMSSDQSTDRTHSRPRVEFLRADMGRRVLEIIYWKM